MGPHKLICYCGTLYVLVHAKRERTTGNDHGPTRIGREFGVSAVTAGERQPFSENRETNRTR